MIDCNKIKKGVPLYYEEDENMKKFVAVLLVISMVFCLTACGESRENESENLAETESQITEEVFDPSTLYGTWTLNMIMPEDDENKTTQIVLEADELIMISDDGSETNYDYAIDEGYLSLNSMTDDTYYEGTYSVTDEGIIEFYVENYQISEAVFEKTAAITNVGETDSGYTGSATVVFYNAIRNLEGSFAHPADSSVTVEVPSNEENYYILPFEITVKNTSESFDAPARLKLTVQENKNIIGGCKDYELPGYISSIVTNVYVRVFYYQNNTWEEDSNDMLPASPYFSETISWDNFAGGKEYKQLGYLLISDVISPKYPDGLPWYIYPNMGLNASLYLDNLHAVAAGVMIMKEDDGSATGRYTVLDATDSEALDAVWAKSEEMLNSLED